MMVTSSMYARTEIPGKRFCRVERRGWIPRQKKRGPRGSPWRTPVQLVARRLPSLARRGDFEP